MNLWNLMKIGSWPSLVQMLKKQPHPLPLTSRPTKMQMMNLTVNLYHYHNLNLKKKLPTVQLNILGRYDRSSILDGSFHVYLDLLAQMTSQPRD